MSVRILAEIAVGTVDLKLLPVAAGENFDFGADGGFVVGQSLERKPQPVILIAAFVAQQHGGPVILRDEQIGGAVVVVVAGDDGARIFELNLVEADVGGDVFEAVRTEIAEESNFSFAFFRFADGDEIDPAVVVIVEGGDAEGSDPVGFGQRHVSKLLPWLLRQRVSAGAPQCVKARSIQPSWSKSRTATPRSAATDAIVRARNFPSRWIFKLSRGILQSTAVAPHSHPPVTIKSTARSLL